MLIECNFCRGMGEAVAAHIIPEAFFRDIGSPNQVLKRRELGKFQKRMPIGIYDNSLWCSRCELKYSRWDAHAIDILRTPIRNFVKQFGGYELVVDDMSTLRLFFVSLLWRASSTSNDFYRHVELGRLERDAVEILKDGKISEADQFSTVISFSGFDDKIISAPLPIFFEGVKYYRFFLGRFVADIKVDTKPPPRALGLFSLGRSDRLKIVSVRRNMALVRAAHKIAKDQLR